MVRPRPVLIASLALLAIVATATAARADDDATPIENLPYRIRVLLAATPEARFNDGRRQRLLRDWLDEVDRFVGAPWRVEVAEEGASRPIALGQEVEALDPARLEPLAAGAEKVWVIRIEAARSGYLLRGREYDAATRRLGAPRRREVPVARDLPRELLRFALDLFAPVALIGERFGKEAALTVRGSAIEPSSEAGRVVSVGTVFRPFRIVPRKDGPAIVREIPFTYLSVVSAEGTATRAAFLSLFSDPFTGRVVQRTSLVALGAKPGAGATRLRFTTLPDRAPASGYALSARSAPDGPPREVGLTDREGRITLPAGFGDGLMVFRLAAGGDEPMREFPLVPGGSADEIEVPAFDPKPLTVALASRLETLRDEVIDLLAVRARVEARLKARFDGEDWAGAEEALREYAALPRRDAFTDELNRLRDEAARRQAEEKVPILTRNVQARIAELQGLIERYLDDEVFRAFADALEKQKAGGPAAKAPAPRP